jgi:hypothetical protein
MPRLRNSILALFIHLAILFNMERLDLNQKPVINLETAVYGLTILAVLMTLSVKGLKKLSPGVLLGLWAAVYVAMKLMLLSRRPLIGDIFTYLTFTEIGMFLIAVLLAQKLAQNIEEFEQAIKNFAFANIAKVKRVEEAHSDIQAEIYRSRRFQRPLSIIVLEQDESKTPTNVNKLVEDAQRALMTQYLSAMMARELSSQLRQTDILLEHDKNGRLIIVSPDTDHDGTEAFISRLKSLARSELFSINFGAATFPNHALTFEQLLERAETELQEQRDGRISVNAPVDSTIDSSTEVKVG